MFYQKSTENKILFGPSVTFSCSKYFLASYLKAAGRGIVVESQRKKSNGVKSPDIGGQ